MKPIRVLLIEDSERDAAHVMLELRRAGWNADMRRVETREEMLSALEESWDAIVCDFHLPRFSAPDALAIIKERGLDIPFIVVSGAIGEDIAVDLMRDGAHDYLLKDRLARLGAAIERELEQAEQRRAKRRAESLFQAVLRASPHASAIIDRASNRVIDGSMSFSRQFLGGAPFPADRPLTKIIQFSQPERIEQLLARGTGTAWHNVYYIDGVGSVANVRCYTVEHDGGSYAYVVIEDVTEQHYLKASFDAINDAVLVISAGQRLLYANRAAEESFGQLYFGTDVEPLLSRPSLAPHWWVNTTSRYDEQRIVINDQPFAATSVVFRFAGDEKTSTILTLRNVAEEEELERLATHDALTGAHNVRYFGETLPKLISNGGALALLDLDHFKPINDELGHAAGDAALITFAKLIRSEIRADDVFARLGGDEFAVLFTHLPLEDVRANLDRIFERMARTPLRFDGVTRAISASCGVAPINGSESVDELRARADRALYDAKRQGRGRFTIASDEA